MEHIEHLLPWGSPGIERRLSVFRFGSGPRKAYIQASLHADELPGMRVAVELKKRLRELEQEGRLNATIELVPVANPIGLSQMFQATHQGRFDFASGKNFNRDFPSLGETVAARVTGRLNGKAKDNVEVIRAAMHDVLNELNELNELPQANSPLEGLQRLLLTHACDADVVLDLHCDFESILLLYCLPQLWDSLEPLANRLGAGAALLAEAAGGDSFDEACSTPWLQLARQFPDAAIPMACMATTLELGGMADTGHVAAEAHAEAILAYLGDLKMISGDWPKVPPSYCEATPFAGAQYAYAPHAGVVSFLEPLGARVNKGDALFEVFDPITDIHTRVCATTNGVLYARERLRFAQPGLWLAKVTGSDPIRQGRLLTD